MLSSLLAIALLHWIAMFSPGPNVLVVTNLAANGSRETAIGAALGVTAVAAIWSCFAVLGLNAIFAAHETLRLAVQAAGGCYLLYLGLRLWRTGSGAAGGSPIPVSPLAGFRLGFITNITNPKALLFFSSVFSTALPASPSAAWMVLAVLLVTVNALVWHLLLAFTFSQRRIQDAYARSRRVIGRTTGILLGAFGVRLLVTTFEALRAR